MTKAIKPWDELSRAEKIKHIFDYPESIRNSQAKDLWGPEVSGYYEHIHFPLTTLWEEIVEVIKSSHYSYTAYVRLGDKDFKIPNSDDLRKESGSKKNLPLWYSFRFDNEYRAFLVWCEKMLSNSRPK
ncbi:hypothetical protein KSZ28_07450 [Bacteroides salyersiae]|uniref:hypothetical protein n=1 Tax=Bacteroides salyersiae TaxID=291644 RepID=UPI001C392945|nr:hypothetical protein [Bacteroides salyersiae]MBV4203546.1 hypothetical protein [Bacteroides salyersiae]MCB6648884.1 hypothetical protein [Bacteroides salyersiae]